MAYKYAQPGPPFNFLGHFSETQKASFASWVNARTGNFAGIQSFHQIRAQQLRKTAGLLELFYAGAPQPLKSTFLKEAWQPGPDGHINYRVTGDHIPMVTVSRLKSKFRDQLQHDDEGVFFMNHVRTLIERHEDEAQNAAEATNSNVVNNVAQLLAVLDGLFAQPQYDAILVKDQSQTYKDEPYFRVHASDAPTQWEKEKFNHSPANAEIVLKDEETADDE